MRVCCIANTVINIPNALARERIRRSIHLESEITDLRVGEIYSVTAIEERDGGIWIFLDTIKECDYPYPYPIELFDIIDNSLPIGWYISFNEQCGGLAIKRLTFKNWANDDYFYEQLVEGEEEAVSIYRRQLSG